MIAENLAYAAAQVVHNFGAVAVAGGALCALSLWPEAGVQRRLAWLVLAGWLAQAASGAAFGAVSLHYYGSLPDIQAVAVLALRVKVLAAVAGVLVAAVFLRRGAHWSDASRRRSWAASSVLAVVALTAAAFLRWFS